MYYKDQLQDITMDNSKKCLSCGAKLILQFALGGQSGHPQYDLNKNECHLKYLNFEVSIVII